MTNAPYDNNNPLLDSFSVLYFLSTFSEDYSFSQTRKNKTIKIIGGQKSTHHIIIQLKGKKLFKVFYQMVGNYFVIQIINLDESIDYKPIKVKLHQKSRNVYIYSKQIIKNNNSDVPLQIQSNKGISEMSDYYNNINAKKFPHNQITSSLFYSVSPFHQKNIKKKKNKIKK